MRPLAAGLILLTLPGLTGCGLTLGPQVERETTWAKMGTPGRIVSDTEADVLVKVDGKDVRSKANVRGMVVLDEPTYELLLKTYQEGKK